MTRFLHVTDLHISAPQTEDPGRQTDTVATFDRMLSIAEQLDPPPQFIIATGDLTNIGDEASYQLIADRLASFDIPVVMTLGNHDKRPAWHSVFPGHSAAPDGSVDHDAVHAGVHIIALDSSIPGKVSGGLDDSQLTKAEEMLNQHADLPKILAIHHPPRINGSADLVWATLDQQSTDRIGTLLEGRNIAAILSGHIHLNRLAMWQGIPLIVTVGQQSSVDVTRSDALAVVEGTGFTICDLQPSGIQATFVPLHEPVLIKEIARERLQKLS